MRFLIPLIILCIFNSCNPRTENEVNIPITINRHSASINKSIIKTDTFYLDKIIHNDSLILNYKYQKTGDTLIFQLLKHLVSDHSITWHGIKSNLVLEKEYTVLQQKLKVKIFNYDNLSSSDEECYIYYTDKYGCLAIDNYGDIGLCYTFEYDKITKELLELIINDTTNITKPERIN